MGYVGYVGFYWFFRLFVKRLCGICGIFRCFWHEGGVVGVWKGGLEGGRAQPCGIGGICGILRFFFVYLSKGSEGYVGFLGVFGKMLALTLGKEG